MGVILNRKTFSDYSRRRMRGRATKSLTSQSQRQFDAGI